jgi:hypothetical protein
MRQPLLLIILFCLSAPLWASPSQSPLKVRVKDLRPTQFTVGKEEVEIRRKMLQKMSRAEYRRYLRQKVGQVVVGPGNKLWLIDGHHLASALHSLGETEYLVHVKHDWSHLSPELFYARMVRQNMMWLYNARDEGPLDPEKLPRSFRSMRDDPYRSLAWKVKKAGGFRNADIPFMEFKWATYFRNRIPLKIVKQYPVQALALGLMFAHSPDAKQLPGYLKITSNKLGEVCLELLLQ